MDKSYGEEHYNRKFKNKKKYEKKSQKIKTGNSYSSKYTRHGSSLSHKVLEQRIVNKAIEKYHIQDYKEYHTVKPPSKTAMPFCVPTNKILNINKQENPKFIKNYDTRKNYIPSNKKSSKIIQNYEEQIKYVHLPKIAPNLYLGNKNAIEKVNELNITVVINISDTNLTLSEVWKRDNSLCNNFYLHNLSNKEIYPIFKIDYIDFRKILNRACDIINEDENKNILIVCNKGINYSVAIAIAYYRLFHLNVSTYEASEYVEKCKLNVDINWNNLTNNRLKNFLKII